MNSAASVSDELHQLRLQLDETRTRLTESKEVLDAICNGEVDGILTTNRKGRQVFMLNGEQGPYQHIIEQMNEGALTLSREGIILYANPTMALLLQTPMEHVIGAAIRNFVDPADSSVLASLIAEAWRGTCQGELHLRVPDGSSLAVRLGLSQQQSDLQEQISVVVTDLTAEKKKTELRRLHTELEKRVAERTADLAASRLAALNMMDDAITARQKSEASRRDLQQEMVRRHSIEHQLLQSQKMEVVGNLAGGIAHDFNNILSAVMANLDLISADHLVLAQGKEYLLEARSELDRAATLTSHLLAFSRRQVLRPVQADLNLIVSNLGRMLRRVLGEHIILDIRPAARAVIVLADVAQIEQVLLNLCVNARDAMVSGGTLTVVMRLQELEEGHAHVNERNVPAGCYACLEITDTGAGMDATTLTHIFEPFFTTKEQGKGTGLGLAMVYGIVTQHGGHIHVSSEPGHGTTFTLYFPWKLNDVLEVDAGVVAVTEDEVRGGTETILVAEDEGAVARGVRRTLERLGYTIILVHDGQQAVETFAREKDRIDLVVLDSVMPRMGGKEAAIRIIAMKPDQKFLFTSGYQADQSSEGEATVLSPDVHFIQKPYAAAGLARAVRRVLDMSAVAEAGGSAS